MNRQRVEAFSDVPCNHHFGFELVQRSSSEAVVSMQPRREFTQEEGVIHGGVLSALADTAAVYIFYPDLAPEQTMTSIEFKMNFLRPAFAAKGEIVARATVIRGGRKVGVCEAEVAQDGKPVAKGMFTYMFYPRENESAG